MTAGRDGIARSSTPASVRSICCRLGCPLLRSARGLGSGRGLRLTSYLSTSAVTVGAQQTGGHWLRRLDKVFPSLAVSSCRSENCRPKLGSWDGLHEGVSIPTAWSVGFSVWCIAELLDNVSQSIPRASRLSHGKGWQTSVSPCDRVVNYSSCNVRDRGIRMTTVWLLQVWRHQLELSCPQQELLEEEKTLVSKQCD